MSERSAKLLNKYATQAGLGPVDGRHINTHRRLKTMYRRASKELKAELRVDFKRSVAGE